MAGRLANHLESHGAMVVGYSSSLANRSRLAKELAAAAPADVLVTELKAAAVDLATEFALERGMEVVFSDNELVVTGGDGPLAGLITQLADTAGERFQPYAVPGAQTESRTPRGRGSLPLNERRSFDEQ